MTVVNGLQSITTSRFLISQRCHFVFFFWYEQAMTLVAKNELDDQEHTEPAEPDLETDCHHHSNRAYCVFRRHSNTLIHFISFIICPIAIAYSRGQIIKSFCSVRACVCVSVCGHSHGRISSSIFTKLDIDV